jgi:biotin transporter BioY
MSLASRKGTVVPLKPSHKKNPKRALNLDEQGPGLGDPASMTIMQRVAYPPRLSLNAILVTVFCFVILMSSGLLPINLTSPLQWGLRPDLQHAMPYTLQLPVAFGLVVFLGPYLGTGMLLCYMALALLGYPLFANGGGLDYISQPGFGYWLATLIVACPVSARFSSRSIPLGDKFLAKPNSSRIWQVLKQLVLSVLAIHALGILYVVGLYLCGQVSPESLPGWLSRLSLEAMPYDCLAILIGCSLIKPIRLLFWWILY